MWRIEYQQQPADLIADGYAYHSPGWWFAPHEIWGHWPPEIVSYVNNFPTADEARRVARMVHRDIKVRIVEVCECGASLSDVGCLNANCPK